MIPPLPLFHMFDLLCAFPTSLINTPPPPLPYHGQAVTGMAVPRLPQH